MGDGSSASGDWDGVEAVKQDLGWRSDSWFYKGAEPTGGVTLNGGLADLCRTWTLDGGQDISGISVQWDGDVDFGFEMRSRL